MNEQVFFNLYVYIVVSIFAQSLVAWELGTKSLDQLLKEVVHKGRPSGKILLAFGLLLVQGIWQKVSGLDYPIKSWEDCWPVLIGVVVFLIGRTRRKG